MPASKIKPIVWQEVKKFILNEEFTKELLARAEVMLGGSEKEAKAKELKTKLKNLDRQIVLLSERIAGLPAEIDPKPLIDRLGELQSAQKAINKAMLIHINPLQTQGS